MSDAGSSVVDDEQPPLEQAVAGATTAVVLLVAFGLLALDVSWFWIVFPVGFGGVLPAAIGLTRYYQQSETSEKPGENDPIETLKERYARGEMDDSEFEKRLEELLRTDTDATGEEIETSNAEREAPRE